MRTTTTAASLVGLFVTSVYAQTSTDCNPTEKTCPLDGGLNQYQYNVDFTAGENKDWVMTYGDASYSKDNGLAFSLSGSGQAPTMQSDFYMFFGTISAMVRAAPGTGIVSCIILESDDLDEIDWEWLGGDVNQVQTNYFGKGNTTTYDRGTYVAVADGTQDVFQNYTLEWTEAATVWYINGQEVRRLNYADALGGQNYPQTPMRIKLGNWIAADTQNEGTIEWAGGKPDFDAGPYTMYVQSIDIVNYNPAVTYEYGDLSGDYTSIVKANGTISSRVTNNSTKIESSLRQDSENQLSASNDTASKTTATATLSPTAFQSGSASQSPPASQGSTIPDPDQQGGALVTSVGPVMGVIMTMMSFFAFIL